MKRIFCIVLIAAFAATFGFSQELRLSGYMNSGLGLWMSNEEDNDDPQLMVYGVDSERFMGRFRLNGSYINEAQTGGADFRLQLQGTGAVTDSGSGAILSFAYGWVRLLDMFTIKAGLVDDGVWVSGDVIFDDDNTEGTGLLLRATPVSGLDLGVGAYLASYAGSGSNNILPVLPTQFALDEAKYTFNLAYTAPGLFRLMGSFRPANEAPGNSATQTAQALASLRLLAVNNLTAVIVAQLNRVDEFGDTGETSIYQTLAYGLGDLSIGLNAAQYIRNTPTGSDAANDLALRFNPWISYALNDGGLVPRLDLTYFMGGQQSGVDYHRRAFTANYDSDRYVVNARPSIKFNLDPRTSLEIGDSFYYSVAGSNADAVFNNVIYVDLTIRF